VINEACGAGLPIVATRQTGAAHDLVREDENGYVVEADDVDGLVDRLEWCILHRDQLPAMGQRSYELVEGISAQSSAVRFQQIIAS
jgi:glycosyltransferase involved in cell wall biosynthesis